MTVDSRFYLDDRHHLVEKATAFLLALNEGEHHGIQKAVYVQSPDVLVDKSFPLTFFDRIYYGVELCEKRIPSPRLLKEMLHICDSSGKPLTLMTPLVTDRGIEQLEPLLQMLAEHDEKAEVVVNEYGALMFIREKFPSLQVVMGRVLMRQKKDPRVAAIRDEKIRGYFSGSILDNPYFCKFIREQGVERVEVDNLPHADPPQTDFSMSIYYPFVLITTSRNCVAETCEECTLVHYNLYHPIMGDELIFYGRSQFVVNLRFDWLKFRQFDRVIYQHYIPF